MNITLCKADETKIRELERASALTWEGMNLDPENLRKIAQAFLDEQLVSENTSCITGFTWNGKTMNLIYHLHGDDQYPDDLPFLSFDNRSFNGTGNLNLFKMFSGARWLDDIVSNNP